MHIKTLCLGALSLEEGSGYDIKKLFEATFSHFQRASYGSIYPALKSLQEEGMVECHIEPGHKHPDRKLFTLTQQGHEALLQALNKAPATELIRSDFLVLMFFAHLLPTAVLQEKLLQIEAHYRHELDYLLSIRKRSRMTAGMHYGIEQGISVYQAKLKHLVQHRDELLASHHEIPEYLTDTAS